ncbi:MAG: hypothetical protein CVU57_05230 [Deltaproteobacteria bacterium HGW-Deltaproteobacteria-15]|nr:MAG: hypothetical protein CVU57_05230 [Deltaproteobacteria bacterium HGW-Deltaproteobacteria-15]
MPDIDYYRPIKYFGLFFVISGFAVFVLYIVSSIDYGFRLGFVIFSVSASLLQIITGLGLLFRRLWGFYLFRFQLHLLYFAFPLGTWLAHRTLRYIDKYRIIEYFK